MADTARSANSTIYATFTQADASVSGYQAPEKQIAEGYNFSPRGIKHALVDGEERGAEQTIVGGKNTSWTVNGINIRQKLTEYQETGLLKTRPEYYDVILSTDKNEDGFLGTLEKNVVVQMRKEIERKDEEAEVDIEEEIKSFLNKIIERNIKKTKENLNSQKNDTFEKDFSIFFVNHM